MLTSNVGSSINYWEVLNWSKHFVLNLKKMLYKLYVFVKMLKRTFKNWVKVNFNLAKNTVRKLNHGKIILTLSFVEVVEKFI